MVEMKDKIKGLRESNGWTQEELAKRTGLSRSAIGNYEQGIRIPGYEELEALSDAFNCPMVYFFEKDRVGPDEFYEMLEMQRLNERESGFIKRYRMLNDNGQNELDRFMSYILTVDDYKDDKNENR